MININTEYTSDALKTHYDEFSKRLIRKIAKSKFPKELNTFLKTNLDDIIKGLPDKLIKIHSNFNSTFKGKKNKKYNSKIKKIFRYDLFSNKKEALFSMRIALPF